MTEFADARKVAALIAAIAEPTRLRVLWQLAKEGPMRRRLADAVNVRMVNMSHHLGVMRQAGVLDDAGRPQGCLQASAGSVHAEHHTDVLGVLVLGDFRIVMWAKTEPRLAEAPVSRRSQQESDPARRDGPAVASRSGNKYLQPHGPRWHGNSRCTAALAPR